MLKSVLWVLALLTKELKYLQSLLGVLKQVVSFSATAKMALYENQHFRVIFSLMNLFDCAVPSSLKACLLDSLAAFCKPHDYSQSSFFNQQVEIISTVWLLLESHNILPMKNGVFTRDGIIFDLEERETVEQTFPETLAFLRLLNVLFSTVSINHNVKTFVTSLGHGSRYPGLDPFISFVSDEVLLKIPQRIFVVPEERDMMYSECLEIINKCLELFEDDCSVFLLNQSLPRITSTSVDATANGNLPYEKDDFIHVTNTPGFKLLCSILSGSRLTAILFSIIEQHDVDSLNSRQYETFYGKSCLTALAIIYRVLNSQNQFLNDFIPLAIEWSGVVSESGLKCPAFSASMAGLDRLLAFQTNVVVSIAMYLNCMVDDQIVLLAARIMRAIAYRPVFMVSAPSEPSANQKPFRQSRIVALFQTSQHRDRILEGFATRLGESNENSSEDLEIEEHQLTNSPLKFQGPESTEMPGYANAVRTSILDLLLGPKESSEQSHETPNISHFLLGYDCTRPLAQSDVNIGRAHHSCLFEVIKLLKTGEIMEANLYIGDILP